MAYGRAYILYWSYISISHTYTFGVPIMYIYHIHGLCGCRQRKCRIDVLYLRETIAKSLRCQNNILYIKLAVLTVTGIRFV